MVARSRRSAQRRMLESSWEGVRPLPRRGSIWPSRKYSCPLEGCRTTRIPFCPVTIPCLYLVSFNLWRQKVRRRICSEVELDAHKKQYIHTRSLALGSSTCLFIIELRSFIMKAAVSGASSNTVKVSSISSRWMRLRNIVKRYFPFLFGRAS